MFPAGKSPAGNLRFVELPPFFGYSFLLCAFPFVHSLFAHSLLPERILFGRSQHVRPIRSGSVLSVLRAVPGSFFGGAVSGSGNRFFGRFFGAGSGLSCEAALVDGFRIGSGGCFSKVGGSVSGSGKRFCGRCRGGRMRIGFGPVSKGCRNTPRKFCDWARPVRRPDNGGSGEIRPFGGGPIGFPVSVGHPRTAVESSAADRAGGGTFSDRRPLVRPISGRFRRHMRGSGLEIPGFSADFVGREEERREGRWAPCLVPSVGWLAKAYAEAGVAQHLRGAAVCGGRGNTPCGGSEPVLGGRGGIRFASESEVGTVRETGESRRSGNVARAGGGMVAERPRTVCGRAVDPGGMRSGDGVVCGARRVGRGRGKSWERTCFGYDSERGDSAPRCRLSAVSMRKRRCRCRGCGRQLYVGCADERFAEKLRGSRGVRGRTSAAVLRRSGRRNGSTVGLTSA